MSPQVARDPYFGRGAPADEEPEPKDPSTYIRGIHDPDADGPAPDEELEGIATNLPEGYKVPEGWPGPNQP